MKWPEKNRYSVYERGTDHPIVIWGSATECATALKMSRDSFYRQVVRTKRGTPPRKYEIIIHDTENEEDVLL